MSILHGEQVRRGKPVWLAEQDVHVKQRYRSLQRRHSVDVAVIGGGITGSLVALTFAEAGVSVGLLEAGLVGMGSTVASAALLLYEPDRGLIELERRYGRANAIRIWQLSQQSVRELVELLRRLSISCELAERDAIHYATSGESARELRAECLRRTSAGFEAEWLTREAVRRSIGVNGGHGAIRTSGNAQFNPSKACSGLIAAAASSGAAVFERSQVTRIDSVRAGVRLRTRSGRLDAATVVIATGYATSAFRPLTGRFRMLRTYALATRQLSPSERRRVGLGEVMIWDTNRPYHYARWTADHRLLLGGGDKPIAAGKRRDTEFTNAASELRQDFEATLPGLRDVAIDHAWEGLFATTPDGLPYVGPHRRYPRHLFALGYGGNGTTFALLAARLLLDYWRGARVSDQRLFRFGRFR